MGSIKKSFATELLKDYDNAIIFDTETTGLNFLDDEIIDLGMIIINKKENSTFEFKKINQLIKLDDGQKLSQTIIDLTHITDEMLLNSGVKRDEFIVNLKDKWPKSKSLIIGYNLHFDMNFIIPLFNRFNCMELLSNCDYLDVMAIYKDRHEYPHKLCAALEFYQIEDASNSHRAYDDAYATIKVLESMYAEKNDILNYVNLFGFNPKFKLYGTKIEKVKYLPQNGYEKKELYK